MPGRLPKKSVDYTPVTPNWQERCAVCDHYDGGNVCSIVAGPVAAAGWCNQWKPEVETARTGTV